MSTSLDQLAELTSPSGAVPPDAYGVKCVPGSSSRRRPSRFRAGAFLEAVETAYLCLTAGESGSRRVVRLTDVWRLFTLRPGTSGDYPKTEFARELNLLDESGVTVTRAGRTVHFSASSGTRTDSTLTTIGRDGRPHIYWGVSFS